MPANQTATMTSLQPQPIALILWQDGIPAVTSPRQHEKNVQGGDSPHVSRSLPQSSALAQRTDASAMKQAPAAHPASNPVRTPKYCTPCREFHPEAFSDRYVRNLDSNGM